MSSASVSKTRLVLEIGNDLRLDCDLKRHLSPRTVGLILRALPLRANAHRLGESIVYGTTPVNSGIERERREFKAGDVAFLPAEGSICFFAKDSKPGKAMTPVGVLSGDLSMFDKVKPGDVLSLYIDDG